MGKTGRTSMRAEICSPSTLMKTMKKMKRVARASLRKTKKKMTETIDARGREAKVVVVVDADADVDVRIAEVGREKARKAEVKARGSTLTPSRKRSSRRLMKTMKKMKRVARA